MYPCVRVGQRERKRKRELGREREKEKEGERERKRERQRERERGRIDDGGVMIYPKLIFDSHFLSSLFCYKIMF
jgi:hypothetical protein